MDSEKIKHLDDEMFNHSDTLLRYHETDYYQENCKESNKITESYGTYNFK